VKVTDILDVPFGMRFSPTDRKGIPHVQKTHTFNFYRVDKFKLNNGGKKSGALCVVKTTKKMFILSLTKLFNQCIVRYR
jgi:hypothetical protein